LSNIVAIAAGSAHGMALRADGTVAVWGRTDFRQAELPAGLSNVIAIADSVDHCLAVVAEPLATPPPPKPDFTAYPASGEAPLTVQFNDQSTGSITSWNWDFGDGSPPTAAQDPSHTYTDAGSYTVTLIVNGPGGSDANSLMIAVTALTPQRQVQLLAAMVDNLLRQGVVNRGVGQRLNADVSGAMRSLNHGQTVIACRDMAAFINDLQAYLRRGAMTQAQAQALTDAVNELRTAIGCQ